MLDQHRQRCGDGRVVEDVHVVDDEDALAPRDRVEIVEQLGDDVGDGRPCDSAAPARGVHPGAICSSAAMNSNQNCDGSRSESSSESHDIGTAHSATSRRPAASCPIRPAR